MVINKVRFFFLFVFVCKANFILINQSFYFKKKKLSTEINLTSIGPLPHIAGDILVGKLRIKSLIYQDETENIQGVKISYIIFSY